MPGVRKSRGPCAVCTLHFAPKKGGHLVLTFCCYPRWYLRVPLYAVRRAVCVCVYTSAVCVSCRSTSAAAALVAEEEAFLSARTGQYFGLDKEGWQFFGKGLGDGDMKVLARLMLRTKNLETLK